MSRTATLVQQHNELAQRVGRPTLATWKGSISVLETRINAMKEQLPKSDPIADAPPAPSLKEALNNLTADLDAKPAKAKRTKGQHPAIKNVTFTPTGDTAKALKAAKAKKAAPAPTGKTFTLADAARDAGVNPKVARAKARRNNIKTDGEGWTFKASRRAEIVKFLKGAE